VRAFRLVSHAEFIHFSASALADPWAVVPLPLPGGFGSSGSPISHFPRNHPVFSLTRGGSFRFFGHTTNRTCVFLGHEIAASRLDRLIQASACPDLSSDA
jgi:hypothetical protein